MEGARRKDSRRKSSLEVGKTQDRGKKRLESDSKRELEEPCTAKDFDATIAPSAEKKASKEASRPGKACFGDEKEGSRQNKRTSVLSGCPTKFGPKGARTPENGGGGARSESTSKAGLE